MKRLVLSAALCLLFANGAYATNANVPSGYYGQTVYPMDTALVMEYLGKSQCYSGDVSANTSTQWDNVTWNVAECGEAETDKPSFSSLVAQNYSAHLFLNRLASERIGYDLYNWFPGAQTDIAGLQAALAGKVDKVTGKGLSSEDFTSVLKAKLDGISAGATANSPDATLLSRANHTGTQAASTISDFNEAAQDAIGAMVSSDLAYDDAAPALSLRPRSQSSVTRSLNSCFQISSSRDSLVAYSVDIAATLSLTSGQTGTVFLEFYNDSGCTTGTQEVSRFVNGNTGSLTVGLNLTQNATGTLSGYVPAGKYVKLRTANTSGAPTFNYRSGQEVLL